MKRFLLFFNLCMALHLAAQNNFTILDQSSEQPVAFAKIVSPDTAIISDINGTFSLPETTGPVKVTMFGYRDTTFRIRPEQRIYFMQPVVQQEDEVTVVAGENPAHRIMQKVIDNRKRNHPMENDAFRYDSYSRFVFDMDPEILGKIEDTAGEEQMLRVKNFLESQHLFLTETSATRTFVPPARDHEEITAYKTSGFSDPLFSTFTREIQSFDYYENQFQLLGKTYINPIAHGGIRRYLFQLQDTLISGADTTFTITFRPRRGKNFDGMQGVLFINTNGYAIEKVIAEPYEAQETFSIKITQEYAFTNSYKWFPARLSTELDLSLNATDDTTKQKVLGRGVIYIRNVTFNPDDIKRFSFDNTEVSTADNASDLREEEWDSLRGSKLSDQDRRTYEVIDSVSQVYHFDRKLRSVLLLAEGKLPLGKFNLDLTRIINYNNYEGYRFGAGLETSDRLNKHFMIGGYFGWATRDKEWKYGGYSEIYLYKKRDLQLDLQYQQDIVERGGYDFPQDNFNLNSPALARRFYIQKMDMQRLAQVGISGLLLANLKLSLFTNYQRIRFTDDYRFLLGDLVAPINHFDQGEIGGRLVWNIGEKVMRLGNRRISKGTKFPKIAFELRKGISGIYAGTLPGSRFDYLKSVIEISHDVSIRGLGRLNWMLVGSRTDGNVPLTLLNTPQATGGKNWNLSVMNTFETVQASDFFHTRQAALFTRFTFLAFKTKAKWNEPQFFVHHALGYGDLRNPDVHIYLEQSAPIRSMTRGYYEAGGGIQNVLIINSMGLGIGGFYNYGYYQSPYVKENITVKITLNFIVN